MIPPTPNKEQLRCFFRDVANHFAAGAPLLEEDDFLQIAEDYGLIQWNATGTSWERA